MMQVSLRTNIYICLHLPSSLRFLLISYFDCQMTSTPKVHDLIEICRDLNSAEAAHVRAWQLPEAISPNTEVSSPGCNCGMTYFRQISTVHSDSVECGTYRRRVRQDTLRRWLVRWRRAQPVTFPHFSGLIRGTRTKVCFKSHEPRW